MIKGTKLWFASLWSLYFILAYCGHNKLAINLVLESSFHGNPNPWFWISDHINYILELRFGGHFHLKSYLFITIDCCLIYGIGFHSSGRKQVKIHFQSRLIQIQILEGNYVTWSMINTFYSRLFSLSKHPFYTMNPNYKTNCTRLSFWTTIDFWSIINFLVKQLTEVNWSNPNSKLYPEYFHPIFVASKCFMINVMPWSSLTSTPCQVTIATCSKQNIHMSHTIQIYT